MASRWRTAEGEALGTVEDVFRSGGGEVLVVTGGRRGEVLVPVVSAIVVEFAPRDGRIVVDGEALGLGPERVRRPRGRRSSRGAPGAHGAPRPTPIRSPPRTPRRLATPCRRPIRPASDEAG